MIIFQISFNGYKSPLKTYYKKGLLKNVKWGIYGEKLNKKTVSLEHLKPRSQGGASALFNYALADRFKNEQRGTEPIEKYTTKSNILRYLSQFVDVKLPNFNGNDYIKGLIQTLKDLKINL